MTDIVSTPNPGYMAWAEHSDNTNSNERFDTFKELAVWLITDHDTYLSADTASEIRQACAARGVAEVELGSSDTIVSMVVVQVRGTA
jgi:hypothetical protein